MNEVEHLLTCLNEELAEVQKDVCKALRFGLGDRRSGASATNEANIAHEMGDVLSIIDMLRARHIFRNLTISPSDRKKGKVAKYMSVAREKGTLQP